MWELTTRTPTARGPTRPNSWSGISAAATPIDAITWANAAHTYQYEGVGQLGRNQCTVGALRSQVIDPDFSGPKVEPGRTPCRDVNPITHGDMSKMMATVMSGGRT